MSEIDIKIDNLDKRLSKVEQHEEKRDEIINQNSTNLSNIIIKLENITKNLETVTSNFKEAIQRSEKRREERDKNIENRISSLEKNFNNLITKFENEKETIEKRVDERTILKDSKNYQNYISDIIKYLLVTGIGFILAIMVNKQ